MRDSEDASTVGRLIGVDLLRGFACLWVVLYHLNIESFAKAPDFFQEPLLAPIILVVWAWASMGFQGVTLFLLISGFCLAYPIARRGPLAETPPTPFLPFLRRRAERILPPYYVALAVWASLLSLPVLGKVTGAHFTTGNLLAKIFFVHNLNPEWVTGINDSFWSLALEMQLYCLFPTLLTTVRKQGIKRTLFMAFLLSLAWQRYGGWVLGTHPPFGEGVAWFFSAIGRLFAFVLGIACAERVVRPRAEQALQSLGALAVLLPLCALIGTDQGTYPFRVWSDTIWSLTFAAMLLYLARVPEALLLSSVQGHFVRPLAALGTISYSVYLWHQPLLRIAVALLPEFCHTSFLATLFTIGAILLMGFTAYTLIEKPILRHRLRGREASTVSAV